MTDRLAACVVERKLRGRSERMPMAMPMVAMTS
jgi:hypothetical protein